MFKMPWSSRHFFFVENGRKGVYLGDIKRNKLFYMHLGMGRMGEGLFRLYTI